MRQLMAILAFFLMTAVTQAQSDWQYGDYTKYEKKEPVSETAATRMADKWSRGFVNFITGIAEIPARTVQGYNEGVSFIDNKAGSRALGTGIGLFRGFGFAVSRIGYGAFEMLTFWGANPATNHRVGWRFDTDFAWELKQPKKLSSSTDMPEEMEKPDANFLVPVGRKVVRGASDFVLGVTELWYQPKSAYYAKGSTKGDVAAGVGLGFWYFISREIHGVQDLVFFLAATPETQVGPAYTIPDPWFFLGKPADNVEDLNKKFGLDPVN